MAGIRLSAIAFCAVVRLAQHLTVLLACSAAATPCGHMVGVHLGFLVDAFRVRIMPNGAQRAIRHVLGWSFRSDVDRRPWPSSCQKTRICSRLASCSPPRIYSMTPRLFRHIGIVQQLFQTFIHGGFRVRIRMVHAIQPTPFLSAHLRPRVLEIRPVKPDGKRKPATLKGRRVVLCRSIACRHTGAT